MGWLMLFGPPVAILLLIDLLVFRAPPRWRALPGPRSRRRSLVPDPFDTLHVQLRLALLAAEIQRLEGDRLVFAKAHRARAAQSAYDALLIEACRLAGIEPRGGTGPEDREREELELASRGWFW